MVAGLNENHSYEITMKYHSWQGIKRKAVYTEGAGPVCKCMEQCAQERSVQGGG